MDLLMWQIRKNCSLFITSGTLSQLTGNTSICNTSKIDFRRLEALSCGVWPSPVFSLLSSRISLQNREKCRFEPTFKKARPARLSERKKPDFKRLSAGTGLTETAPKRTPPSQLHKRLEMSCSQKEPRVRIPNSPPKTQSYQGFCPYDWAFLFSQGHIGVHDFRQELRCASRSALCPAELGYCPFHLPR